MLLLEMVRGRKNIDVIVDNTSQVYFLYWIYNRLDQGEELHIRIEEEDTQIVKKIDNCWTLVYSMVPSGSSFYEARCSNVRRRT